MMNDYTERLKLYNLLNIKMTKELAEIIFIILKKNKDNFSENSNGIFFDLGEISSKSIEEINQSLEIQLYCTC
jgi:hypothetical protein